MTSNMAFCAPCSDPRVHYPVNCASIGCPNLQTEAFTGAKLEDQLDVAARAYVNHPRGVIVGSNGVTVSSIYNWFKAAFGGNDEGVLKHLCTTLPLTSVQNSKLSSRSVAMPMTGASMTCSIDPMGDARGERAASPPRVEPYDCTQCVGARIV
jgi:Protein of unknown function, DUF547